MAIGVVEEEREDREHTKQRQQAETTNDGKDFAVRRIADSMAPLSYPRAEDLSQDGDPPRNEAVDGSSNRRGDPPSPSLIAESTTASTPSTCSDSPPPRVRFAPDCIAGDSGWSSPARESPDSSTCSAGDPKESAGLRKRLQKTQEKLVQSQIDLSAEKAIRMRKEKLLFKMAKELSKRTEDSDFKAKKIFEMASTIAQMEKQVDAAVKAAAAHHRETTLLQDLHRAACLQFDETMQQQRNKQEQQTAALLQQVLQSNLEADRLRARLAALEMRKEPAMADEVVQRTLFANENRGEKPVDAKATEESQKLHTQKKPRRQARQWALRCLTFMTFSLALLCLAIIAEFRGATMGVVRDLACAPVKPGTSLSAGQQETVVMEAPWWAPADWKESVYSKLCEYGSWGAQSRVGRTRLVWKNGDLTATAMDVKSGIKGKQLLKLRALSVLFDWETIRFKNKKNSQSEDVDAPWSSVLKYKYFLAQRRRHWSEVFASTDRFNTIFETVDWQHVFVL